MNKKICDYVDDYDEAIKITDKNRTELFEVLMDSGYKCYVDHSTMKEIKRNMEKGAEGFLCARTYHFNPARRTATLYYNPVYLMYSHISSWRAFMSIEIIPDEENTDGDEI